MQKGKLGSIVAGVLAIFLVLICLFYLSFTLVNNHHEDKAVEYAMAKSNDKTQSSETYRKAYKTYDDDAEPDDKAPTIDYAYLNHSSFTNGSIVNEQPMFIAGVSDDVAINLSTAGIGHQMTLKLDDRRSFGDVSLYYTPASDGSPSGTIAYPISDLEAGNHTLAFQCVGHVGQFRHAYTLVLCGAGCRAAVV